VAYLNLQLLNHPKMGTASPPSEQKLVDWVLGLRNILPPRNSPTDISHCLLTDRFMIMLPQPDTN
jgi:hypothetical protein